MDAWQLSSCCLMHADTASASSRVETSMSIITASAIGDLRFVYSKWGTADSGATRFFFPVRSANCSKAGNSQGD